MKRIEVVGPDGKETPFVLETDVELKPPHGEFAGGYEIASLLAGLLKESQTKEIIFADIRLKVTRQDVAGKCILKFERIPVH